jgi:hypothetical protein
MAEKEEQKKDSKLYSRFTWLVVVGPLLFFFGLTMWVADFLEGFGPWRDVVPVIIVFAVAFFIAGVFLRGKFGRLML